jgi:tetratricopeptide (TPR) repeat protein
VEPEPEPLAAAAVAREAVPEPAESSGGDLEIDLDREVPRFVPVKLVEDELDLRLDEEPLASAPAPWTPAPAAPAGSADPEATEMELELRAEEFEQPGAIPMGDDPAAQGRSLEEELILEEIAAEEGREVDDSLAPSASERSLAGEDLGPPGEDLSAALPDPGPDLEEAEFYASQGMLAEAIALYERAVAARPDEDAPKDRLAELLAMTGPSGAGADEEGGIRAALEGAGGLPVSNIDGSVTDGAQADRAEEIAPPDRSPDLDRRWTLEEPDAPAPEVSRADGARGDFDARSGTEGAEEEAPIELRDEVPDGTQDDQPPREPDGVWDESVFIDEDPVFLPPAPVVGIDSSPLDESGFDLRAELDEALPADIGGVTQATEALSELVSELQIREEAEGATHDAQTHYDLGIAYKEMGLLDDAIRELRMASRDDGRRVDCLTVLGICYLELGKPEEALGLFEQALSHGSVAGTVAAGILYEMGMAHESAGNAAGALECYTRVAAIDPAYREIAERLARLSGDAEPPKPKRGRKKKISYL